MSETFLDIAQTVSYDFEKKTLVITLSDRMAEKMQADGWNVRYEKEIGHFIHVTLTDDEP